MAGKKNDFGTGIAAGIGIIGAIATGYFLYGPQGAQHRKKVRAWTIKAKGEVLSELEKMKDVTEESYEKAIEKTAARYAKVKDIQPEEVLAFVGELKRHWKSIQKQLKPAPVKKAAKKTVKKAASKKK
jgi:pyruvate-formate lyase-activating enzyme